MRNLLLMLVLGLSFASCRYVSGSGNIVTDKRKVDDFRRISAGGAFEVELRNGPFSVDVEADDNLQKLVETRVSGKTLKINLRGNYSISNGHFKVYVSAPEIEGIESSGASKITVAGVLKNIDKISLQASGAGSIKVNVDAPRIDAESSGAGSLEISGRTRDLDADASGGASIKAGELLTENTTATSSGAGNIHVHASVSLNAKASGAGSIYYRGGASVQSRVSGAGGVHKED